MFSSHNLPLPRRLCSDAECCERMALEELTLPILPASTRREYWPYLEEPSFFYCHHFHALLFCWGRQSLSLLFYSILSLWGHGHGKQSLTFSLFYSYYVFFLIWYLHSENIAKRFLISRHDQDDFALSSHRKAAKAKKLKHFSSEIVPVGGVFEDDGEHSSVYLHFIIIIVTYYQL